MRDMRRLICCELNGNSAIVEMTNGYYYYYENGMDKVLVVHNTDVVTRFEPDVLEDDGYHSDLEALKVVVDKIMTLPAEISPLSTKYINVDASEL